MAGEPNQPMTHEKTTLSPDDKAVFDALERAQKQYDEYIKITRAVSFVDSWTDSIVCPPADVPLSLTIWPER